jgi:hypothetical protein
MAEGFDSVAASPSRNSSISWRLFASHLKFPSVVDLIAEISDCDRTLEVEDKVRRFWKVSRCCGVLMFVARVDRMDVNELGIL